MPTPMISFRLDPTLTALMDGRCKISGETRADFLRQLIIDAVGSPAVEGQPDDAATLAIADFGARLDRVEARLRDLLCSMGRGF